MAFLSAVSGLGLILEYDNFPVFVVGLNLGKYLGASDERSAKGNLTTIGNRQNFAEFGYRVNDQRQLFYIEGVPGLNPVLFPSTLKNSIIHYYYPEFPW